MQGLKTVERPATGLEMIENAQQSVSVFCRMHVISSLKLYTKQEQHSVVFS